MRRPKPALALVFAAAIPFVLSAASDPNTGLLWGRVVDARGAAVPGAGITVLGEDPDDAYAVAADAGGRFSLAGLRPGTYLVRASAPGFASAERRDVAVEPLGRVSLTFVLEAGDAGGSAAFLWEDILPAARTYIPAGQIERLPSGNGYSSLIENQDAVATTDRIDVGGMWSSLPTLFSARGASSWTRNVFLIDGLDVTEPFDGGTPLVIPDVFALAAIRTANSAPPIQALTPGAYFDLVPREGGASTRGGGWAFYSDRSLSGSNITPALEAEGIRESHTLHRLMDVNLHLGGPFADNRWRYFTSWTSQSAARDLAAFDPLDESRLHSGMVHLVRRGEGERFRVLWTGQFVDHPSYRAGRAVPWEATSDRQEIRNALQFRIESAPRPKSAYRYGLSLSHAAVSENPQEEFSAPYRSEMFRGLPGGAAPEESRENRALLAAFFDGRSILGGSAGVRHILEYGAEGRFAAADGRTAIPGNVRLRFLDGAPVEALLYESPFSHRESAAFLDAFLQETIVLPSGLSLSLGLHASGYRGSSVAGTITGLDVSPRLSLQIPLARARTAILRITAARTYARLPLGYLVWGQPDAERALVAAWTDANGDGLFSSDEAGPVRRREGPGYGALDPDLKLPATDELTVSVTRDLGRGWMFSLAGFLRETRRLVETRNVGVPFSSYIPRLFEDIGDDRIPGTIDDLSFTVWDRKAETFGLDAFLLTNPDPASRASTYMGLDLVLVKRPTDRFLFFLAMTATQAWQTNPPGNTARENDDGMIGLLYDDPNASINARGRPRFDRAYTIRAGFSLDLPLGTRIGVVAKYYDGQPFARWIIVPGLAQGPVLIQAHPRGVARYEFNMTVDLRLEKRFRLSFGTLRLMADVFNLFNQNLALEESPWTRPEFPLRYATEIQSPRVWRLGMNFEF